MLLTLAPTLFVYGANFGSQFPYNGQLIDGNARATGVYDFRFALFDDPTGGIQVGITSTNKAVSVNNGFFSAEVDFGNIFGGTAYWMEVGVRHAADQSDFVTLLPRPAIDSVPYALFSRAAETASLATRALTAAAADSIAASNLFGIIPLANLSSNVALLNGNPIFSGTLGAQSFVGNGAGLTNIPASALANPSTSDVKRWGAVGDGVTDDTLAIRAAVAAVGSGVLAFSPGTYLISGQIDATANNQTLDLQGATIKRANSVSSITTTAISTGSPTTVVVSDGTRFRIGMQVVVFDDSSYDPHNHTITKLAGNTLTLDTIFTVPFLAGGTVASSHSCFFIGSSLTNVTIRNGEIDGNRRNNQALVKWEIHNEISFNGSYCTVKDVFIHDAQCEGIVGGGQNGRIIGNRIINCGGNGIHVSSDGGQLLIQNNFVQHCNLNGVSPGHADGCIVWSQGGGNSIVTGNYCEDGISGFGSIDSADNNRNVIVGNMITNCFYALEMRSNGESQGEVDFSHNKIFNCTYLRASEDNISSKTYGPNRILMAYNEIIETELDFRGGHNLDFSHNYVFSTNSLRGNLLSLHDMTDTKIIGNDFVGGIHGVYIASTLRGEYKGCSNIRISNNTFKNNHQSGIFVSSDGTHMNCVASDNTILIDDEYTPASWYEAIYLGGNCEVLNNTIDAPVGTGVYVSSRSANFRIAGNTIKTPVSIRIKAGAVGVAENNWIEGTVVNDAAAAMLNNQIIGSATGNVGIGTPIPAPGALLELASTNRVFLPPRMTKTQRNAIVAPPEGSVIYQIDSAPGLRTYSGSNWIRYAEILD